MIARYAGWCSAGSHGVKPGDSIVRGSSGWSHSRCLAHGFESVDRAIRRQENADYRDGIAAGRVHAAERRVYGAAIADQFARMDEDTRYWKYGLED